MGILVFCALKKVISLSSHLGGATWLGNALHMLENGEVFGETRRI